MTRHGVDFRLSVPHKSFNRPIGPLAGLRISRVGQVVSESTWRAGVTDWLPTADDTAFVQSLMGRVVEPGRFANWIAPPAAGIYRRPLDFRYVRIA